VSTVHEVEAKSILRRHKRVDSWFLSSCSMNLYRGCEHACVYCDGRAERYHVTGEFGREVTVKVNAAEILARELDPKRRRKPLERAYLLLGGGVGDSYQPAEAQYRLTRQVLELLCEREPALPVHILTKSTLVTRDVDLLTRLNERTQVIVSFSLSSDDDPISATFEPRAAPPSARLEAIQMLSGEGLACGVFLVPVIPYVTDGEELIERSVASAKAAGADFVLFGGMTLKGGRQREFFLTTLERTHPDLVEQVAHLYAPTSKWGNATRPYYEQIEHVFTAAARKHEVARRIPPHLHPGTLGENDRVTVILEHLDYLLAAAGRRTSYRTAARTIADLDRPLSELRGELRSLKGVGQVTERLINEVLATGTSAYYEQQLRG
jgi:DNA repair photolyase